MVSDHFLIILSSELGVKSSRMPKIMNSQSFHGKACILVYLYTQMLLPSALFLLGDDDSVCPCGYLLRDSPDKADFLDDSCRAGERRRNGADDASWRGGEEGVLPVGRRRGSGAAAVWSGRDGAVQMTRGALPAKVAPPAPDGGRWGDICMGQGRRSTVVSDGRTGFR